LITKYKKCNFSIPNSDFHRSFCEQAKITSQDLMDLARELANANGQNYALNSKTYRVIFLLAFLSYKSRFQFLIGIKVRKKSSSPQKVGSVWSNHCTTLKGAFFFEADSMISHQYTLTISQTGKYQISIHVSKAR